MSIPSGAESGVAVIWYLLANNAGVTAVVPAARIVCGDVDLKAAIPAIGITQVLSRPQLGVRVNESPHRHVDHVQVTVYRKTGSDDAGYPGLKSLLALVLAACPSQRGSVNGIRVDSIVPDVEGPDFSIPELAVVGRSQDFIVRWSA